MNHENITQKTKKLPIPGKGTRVITRYHPNYRLNCLSLNALTRRTSEIICTQE